MRATIFIIILCVASSIKTKAQEQNQKANIIISVDGKVVAGSIYQIKIISYLESGLRKIINADYYPGNMVFLKSDYMLLMSDETKSIVLSFSYLEFCEGKRYDYSYEIDFDKKWLQDKYFVLYVYNTDKNKYNKLYPPIKGKHYTYEFDYPGGQMRRVKKVLDGDCE